MITLFTGGDVEKRRAAHLKFMAGLPAGTEVFKISPREFDPLQIESFYSGAGLFFKTSAIVFTNCLDAPEVREFILGKLPQMTESGNYFVFIEGRLSKATLEAFRSAGAQVNFYEPGEQGEKFNNFLLANALGKRDKLGLWLSFRQAVLAGVSLEELIGVLFWKAKDMILKKNFAKFKEAELEKFAGKLSYLLPEARQGGRDAEAALEQYILEAI